MPKNSLGYHVEGDVTKLPKWAQHYVALLERELANARRDLAVQGDVNATNVTFSRIASLDDEYIPDGSRVTFKLPRLETPTKPFRVRVMIDRDGRLDINADGRINVSPNAVNSLTISEAN